MREIMNINKAVFWGILVIVFTVALSYATNKLMEVVKE